MKVAVTYVARNLLDAPGMNHSDCCLVARGGTWIYVNIFGVFRGVNTR